MSIPKPYAESVKPIELGCAVDIRNFVAQILTKKGEEERTGDRKVRA